MKPKKTKTRRGVEWKTEQKNNEKKVPEEVQANAN